MTVTAPETIPDLHLIEDLDWQPVCSNDECEQPATHVLHMACGCVLPCCLPCAVKVKRQTDRAIEAMGPFGLAWECNACHRGGTCYPILRIEPLP